MDAATRAKSFLVLIAVYPSVGALLEILKAAAAGLKDGYRQLWLVDSMGNATKLR